VGCEMEEGLKGDDLGDEGGIGGDCVLPDIEL
jgi:hypothetical protein